MIYGYARCSTNESKQDITRQTRELKEKGAEKVYIEWASGAKIDREQLLELLDRVVEGDTIIALEVSRITRSTKQLCDLIDLAKEKKIRLILGDFIVDCSKGTIDAMTEGMLKMMGVFAELERNITSARVKSGMAHAKANGKKIGRPEITKEDIPNNVIKAIELLNKNKINKTECARMCGISRPTLNKYIEVIEQSR